MGGLIVNSIQSAGGIELPVLGSLHVWQAVFIFAAVPGIPVAILFFLSVKEPPRRPAPANRQTGVEFRRGFRQAIRYLMINRRLFLSVFLGLSLIAAAQFALTAWIPAFFIRVHDWSAGDIGYLQGLLFLIGATVGVVAGGWVTDGMHARGYRDANLRIASYAALFTIPWAVAFAAVADGSLAIFLFAPVIVIGAAPFGASIAVIPMVSPPQFRVQLVAIYLMIVVPLLLLIGSLLTFAGWRPLREQLTVISS